VEPSSYRTRDDAQDGWRVGRNSTMLAIAPQGTNDPRIVSNDVLSECIRLTRDDIVDLYMCSLTCAKFVLLAAATSSAPGATPQ
jgi:hypothetical protein